MAIERLWRFYGWPTAKNTNKFLTINLFIPYTLLKGQCHRIYDFMFFS